MRYAFWVNKQFVSLCICAIIAAGLWRVEIEWHGWAGLTWIKYFHWAVPIGYFMFVGWVGVTCGVLPWKKRALLIGLLIVIAPVLHVMVARALYFRFVGGPSFLGVIIIYGEDGFRLLRRMIIVVYPALPVAAWIIARSFGIHSSPLRLVASLVVFITALPVAIVLLAITNHIGGPNPIHAIKSGFIIPMLFVGAGIPFLTFSISGAPNHCATCQYNMHGLSIDATCPECGETART